MHIAIGMAPLSCEAPVVVIQDPAKAMDLISNQTIEALRARTRSR